MEFDVPRAYRREQRIQNVLQDHRILANALASASASKVGSPWYESRTKRLRSLERILARLGVLN